MPPFIHDTLRGRLGRVESATNHLFTYKTQRSIPGKVSQGALSEATYWPELTPRS